MLNRSMKCVLVSMGVLVALGVGQLSAKEAKPIPVLLLTALPGSGKSEVRRYLSTLDSQECLKKFGIGATIEIDDFPYVHMMRRVSDELTARGHEGLFFLSPAYPFRDGRDWGTLDHLINEDYHDIIKHKKINPKSAAQWVFKRIDAARTKVGCSAAFKRLPRKLYKEIARAVEADAAKLLKDKVAQIEKSKDLTDKTIVIEFSRGGADSAPMPLPAPYGYKYSLGQLSPDLLEKASVLYIWVSPEESRRKNEARANPKDPGSILNHAVPRAVMYVDYGCDDMAWLEKNSTKPGTIALSAHRKTYHLPFGRFDNRVDKTTFTHAPAKAWNKKNVQALRTGLEEAFKSLA